VSSAREVYRDGSQALATTDTTVATMTNVVPGSYVISAKTNVNMNGAGSAWAVTCTLDAGGGNSDTAEDGFNSNVAYVDLDHEVSLDMQVTRVFASTGSIVLKCRSTDAASASVSKIHAIKVTP
jgi:hypothetical protein